MWEAMAEHASTGGLLVGYCEPRKTRDNCPNWGARDAAVFLKAIAEAPVDGIRSEEYTVADVSAVQAEHVGDDKALAKAMKVRAALVDALTRKSVRVPVVAPAFTPIATASVAPVFVVRPLSSKEQKRRELYDVCYAAHKAYRAAPTTENLSAWEQAKAEYAKA
jgi:hypothetical protein